MSKMNRVAEVDDQLNDLIQASRFHSELYNWLLMSAMGQELGSCEFLAIPFSVSLIVNFGPELHHGLGFVYGMALDVISSLLFPPTHSIL